VGPSDPGVIVMDEQKNSQFAECNQHTGCCSSVTEMLHKVTVNDVIAAFFLLFSCLICNVCRTRKPFLVI